MPKPKPKPKSLPKDNPRTVQVKEVKNEFGPRADRHSSRRGGARWTHKKEEFELTYGNATNCSEKAEHFFLNNQSDAFALSEAHLIKDEAIAKAEGFTQKWHMTVAPAQPSKDSKFGSYGASSWELESI